MAFAETAELVTELSLKDNLSRGLKTATRNVQSFNRATSELRGNIVGLGKSIGRGAVTGLLNVAKLATVGFVALGGAIALGVRELEQYQQATFATNQVLKTTGGVSKQTAKSIRDLSESIEDATTIDDKLVQSAANVLLTFTRIQGKTFPRTLRAATDLSAALDKDLNSSVILLGKALNDPEKGLTALARAGVRFTAQQEKQIKTLLKAGKVEQAQNVILKELEKRFGGLAKAKFGTGLTATFNRLRDSFEDATRALVEGLEPGITRVADFIRAKLVDPATLGKIRAFGATLAGFLTSANLEKAGRILNEVAESVRGALPLIRESLAFSGQVISKAIGLFKSLPPDLQKIAIAALAVNKLTGGAVTSVVGDLLKIGLSSLKTITAGVVNVIGGTVNGVGGIPGTGGGGIGGTIATGLKSALVIATGAAAFEGANQAVRQATNANANPFLSGDAGLGFLTQHNQAKTLGPQAPFGQGLRGFISGIAKAANQQLAASTVGATAAKLLTGAATKLQDAATIFAKARALRGDKTSFQALTADLKRFKGGELVTIAAAMTKALSGGGKGNVAGEIRVLEKVHARLLQLGDKRGAAKIASDIQTLTGVLRKKKTAPTVKVNVNASQRVTVNGRKWNAALNQSTTYRIGSGGVTGID